MHCSANQIRPDAFVLVHVGGATVNVRQHRSLLDDDISGSTPSHRISNDIWIRPGPDISPVDNIAVGRIRLRSCLEKRASEAGEPPRPSRGQAQERNQHGSRDRPLTLSQGGPAGLESGRAGALGGRSAARGGAGARASGRSRCRATGPLRWPRRAVEVRGARPRPARRRPRTGRTRGSRRAPPRRRHSLIARNLGANDVLDEPPDLSGEVLRHALLVAADAARELRRFAVSYLGGQHFDAGVDRDLGVLLAELVLSVAQVRLGLLVTSARADPDLAFDGGDGLAGDLADRGGNGEQAPDRLGPPSFLIRAATRRL